MNRETFAKSSQQTTNETAYYLSNYQHDDKQHAVKSLARRLSGNRADLLRKSYFGPISRSFSLNRITIHLKCSKNLSQNSFPSPAMNRNSQQTQTS
jgi:hypothetical protein